MNPHDNATPTQKFALEVMAELDSLARPEIKNKVIEKFWDWGRRYFRKVILKKKDQELQEKLLVIHKKLNSKFKDVDFSVNLQVQEELSDIKIPRVGEMQKKADLVKIKDSELAELVLKEVGL